MSGYTHTELATYTHEELTAFTHGELGGEWMKKQWGPTDYYTHRDLNRIESTVEFLYSLVPLVRPGIPPIESVTDRTMSSVEFAESLNRLESNIEALGVHLYKPDGWVPTVTDWEPLRPFSYVDANRYEINVDLLYTYIVGNSQNIPYCGQIYIGEEWI